MFEALKRLKTEAARNPWIEKNFSKEDNDKIKKLVEDYKKLSKEYNKIYDNYAKNDDISGVDILEFDDETEVNQALQEIKQTWKKLDKINKQKYKIEKDLDKIGGEGFCDIVFGL